jgi:hypothetical protein
MILDVEREPLENVAYSDVVPKITVVWYLSRDLEKVAKTERNT